MSFSLIEAAAHVGIQEVVTQDALAEWEVLGTLDEALSAIRIAVDDGLGTLINVMGSKTRGPVSVAFGRRDNSGLLRRPKLAVVERLTIGYRVTVPMPVKEPANGAVSLELLCEGIGANWHWTIMSTTRRVPKA